MDGNRYNKTLFEKVFACYEQQTWQQFCLKYQPKKQLSEEARKDLIKFFSSAIFALIDEWFLRGMKESEEDLVHVLENLINQNICLAYASFCGMQIQIEIGDHHL